MNAKKPVAKSLCLGEVTQKPQSIFLLIRNQKGRTSSYKIHNVQHEDCSSHCYVRYREVVRRVNPKSSRHKENIFSFFLLLLSI